jgi:hypothetical protein
MGHLADLSLRLTTLGTERTSTNADPAVRVRSSIQIVVDCCGTTEVVSFQSDDERSYLRLRQHSLAQLLRHHLVRMGEELVFGDLARVEIGEDGLLRLVLLVDDARLGLQHAP